jgi:large subunit ribosomal protein L3
MVRGILAKKIGMTQLFDELGRVVPVTVVQAGPCVVVQRKTQDKDGYEAVQLGLVEVDRPLKVPPRTESGWRRRAKGRRRVSWPLLKHFDKAGVPPTRFVAEIPVDAGDAVAMGDAVLVEIFQPSDQVKVIGRSRGRGFQGVIRRHNFRGGRATHGSMFHREPGSIGSSAYPSRVLPGLGMPGHMGDRQVTMKNVKVVKVDAERNLLFLKGGVPGARNGFLRIVKVL